jgi:predicted O-methyltransferase YrrM
MYGNAALKSILFSTKSDESRKRFILAGTSLLSVAVVVLGLVSIHAGLVLVGILLCATLGLIVQVYSNLVRSVQALVVHEQGMALQNSRQTQALLYLYSKIRPRRPLPGMRDMAISPDFGATLAGLLLESSCAPSVVEFGSGTSTLIVSYCLEQIGGGSLLSLDHDNTYAAITCSQLREHQLDAIGHVRHAPLCPIPLPSGIWQWYDTSSVSLPRSIDVLIVDGPPMGVGPLARYPALPLFYERLSASAIVVVDDASRPDEQAMVSRWLKEYPVFTHEFLQHEKGTVILRRMPGRG